MENGRGGIAIFNNVTQEVVQFISYRGSFMANDGVADGTTADDIGVIQPNNTPDDMSLQLIGTGTCPSDFTWAGLVYASKGGVNSNQNLLPVELLSFTAQLAGEEVLVEWETAIELNNDYMAVERSTDGRNFEEIGQVSGAGTTYEPQYYRLWDRKPVPGINYYRLRQVDYDGTVNYHKIVAVQYKTDESIVLLYPTVSTDRINLQLSAPAENTGQIRIVGLTGQVLQSIDLEIGQSQWEIPIDELIPGHYFVQIERNGAIEMKRFIKI